MKFSGVVVKGDGEGAALGYPTANLDVQVDLEPGVYPAWVTHLGERLPAVLCLGVVGASGTPKCEVHLIDFIGDLYGQPLEVEIVGGRVSGIEKIEDEASLRRKIGHDVSLVKKLLGL